MSVWFRTATTLLVLVGGALVASAQTAPATSVQTPEIALTGESPPVLQELVAKNVQAGLDDAGVAITPGSPTTLRVEVNTQSTNYAVTSAWTADGKEPRRLQETCSLCTLGELSQTLRQSTRRLALGTEASTPAANETVATQVARSATEQSPQPWKFGVWKWVTGGTAVALLGVGLYTWSIQGEPTCNTPLPSRCESLHDNPYALYLASAAITGGVAAWMFYYDHQHANTVMPLVSVDTSSVSLGMLGRF